MIEKEMHDKEHNSIYDPKPDCEFCRNEVFRRSHRCFGDGRSSVPIPVKVEE